MGRAFIAAVCTFGLFACPPNPNPDGGTQDAGVCGNFANVHEELLNAPTSATTVQKTPAIPEGSYP